MQTGQLFIGGGLDGSELTPVTADDVGRQAARGVIPRFFTSVTKTADGFRDVEYVEILVPGDTKSVPVHRVDDNIRQRFAAQYQAWKAGRDQASDGTPLELMVGNGALLHELRAKNIFVVEALADLTDGQLDAVGMGARELREKARSFIARKNDLAAVEASEAKDEMIRQLKARLDALEGASPRPDAVQDADAPVGNHPPEGAVAVTSSEPITAPRRGPGQPRKTED